MGADYNLEVVQNWKSFLQVVKEGEEEYHTALTTQSWIENSQDSNTTMNFQSHLEFIQFIKITGVKLHCYLTCQCLYSIHLQNYPTHLSHRTFTNISL
jgi:hypothetical protein